MDLGVSAPLAGQACSAGSRILVQDDVAEPFLALLVAAARRLRVGPALEPSVLMGPLISAEARTRVEGHLRRAKEQGARTATGGARPSHVPEGGWYLEPTVLVDVPEDADCLREEIFGPVVTVESFGNIDDALTRANATPFGLTSGVWTADPRLGRQVADALDAGTVWINRWHSYHPAAPFGGRGASGHGHVCGPHAVHQFLTPKTVWGAGASPG